MFPYPSGEGLHVGHPKGYIATDIVSRMKRMQGYNVLHPMGFDAFGLPAENYAIKTKTNPQVAVKKNVARYKKQLEILGFDYDWSREVNTTDPKFYKWTQWIFLQFYKKGLAHQSYEPIDWCPLDKTGLAKEDIEDGKCERCGTPVEKKLLRQWTLKITDYADRLLDDLDLKDDKGNLVLNWPESIKESQRNWIGRSEGTEFDFQIKNQTDKITVFTTRADTIFGVTYIVLAPEQVLVERLLAHCSNKSEIEAYIESAKKKTIIDRIDAKKEKTGLELKGVRAINPVNQEEVSVWIADYVLADYGTGAVMAVPAHDDRDFQFAEKYKLPVKEVVVSLTADRQCPFVELGVLKDSGVFSSLQSSEAQHKITEEYGREVVKYKLRDWVFSRQRYWGEPIPMIHCDTCGIVPVPEKDLPVTLPKVKYYEPTGTGESPLAAITKWVNIKCPTCRGKAKRETNTMPQWAGSSWYYLRYIDSKNKKTLIDSKKEKYWSPVDMYIGGAEHATRHLIYARFWHKFLYDIGVVSGIEPFKRLQGVGLIMAEDGRKMSKRYGNVVNPDEIVDLYGADTLRLYEMFMGPFDQAIAWSTSNIIGSRRFIERVWNMQYIVSKKTDPVQLKKQEATLHKTIQKVSGDIVAIKHNTAISSLMIALNELEKEGSVAIAVYESILKLLAPFVPHITEEIWSRLGHHKSIHIESWPTFDSSKVLDSEIKIIIQINGKVRDEIIVSHDISEKELTEAVLKRPFITKWTENAIPKKIIYVKNRLINIVV